MALTGLPKKIWSPNSPFGKEHSVFRASVAQSLCARSKARLVSLADAMASLTRRLEPARWTDAWLRARFIKMGMPRSNGELVLVFQGEFSEAVAKFLMNEAEENAAQKNFDEMVDMGRGGGHKVFAHWTNRPSIRCKTPGGPALNSQQAKLAYRKEK